MNEYIISDNLYLDATPSGVFYAVQDDSPEPGRQFIHRLMQHSETPAFDTKIAEELSQMRQSHTLELVHWLQEAGFIVGVEQKQSAPQIALEQLLPELLASLSDEGKAILAESRGLYMGSSGFTHEAAEELAALSANLTSVYSRHKELLHGNLGYQQHGWGLINATGNSKVCFWPLYLGGNQFTLIIEGIPQLNQTTFKQLVWALEMRYGNTLSDSS